MRSHHSVSWDRHLSDDLLAKTMRAYELHIIELANVLIQMREDVDGMKAEIARRAHEAKYGGERRAVS